MAMTFNNPQKFLETLQSIKASHDRQAAKTERVVETNEDIIAPALTSISASIDMNLDALTNLTTSILESLIRQGEFNDDILEFSKENNLEYEKVKDALIDVTEKSSADNDTKNSEAKDSFSILKSIKDILNDQSISLKGIFNIDKRAENREIEKNKDEKRTQEYSNQKPKLDFGLNDLKDMFGKLSLPNVIKNAKDKVTSGGIAGFIANALKLAVFAPIISGFINKIVDDLTGFDIAETVKKLFDEDTDAKTKIANVMESFPLSMKNGLAGLFSLVLGGPLAAGITGGLLYFRDDIENIVGNMLNNPDFKFNDETYTILSAIFGAGSLSLLKAGTFFGTGLLAKALLPLVLNPYVLLAAGIAGSLWWMTKKSRENIKNLEEELNELANDLKAQIENGNLDEADLTARRLAAESDRMKQLFGADPDFVQKMDYDVMKAQQVDVDKDPSYENLMSLRSSIIKLIKNSNDKDEQIRLGAYLVSIDYKLGEFRPQMKPVIPPNLSEIDTDYQLFREMNLPIEIPTDLMRDVAEKFVKNDSNTPLSSLMPTYDNASLPSVTHEAPKAPTFSIDKEQSDELPTILRISRIPEGANMRPAAPFGIMNVDASDLFVSSPDMPVKFKSNPMSLLTPLMDTQYGIIDNTLGIMKKPNMNELIEYLEKFDMNVEKSNLSKKSQAINVASSSPQHVMIKGGDTNTGGSTVNNVDNSSRTIINKTIANPAEYLNHVPS